ncbi:hypothetical protein Tco_0716164 [Tanacetum coccineum]
MNPLYVPLISDVSIHDSPGSCSLWCVIGQEKVEIMNELDILGQSTNGRKLLSYDKLKQLKVKIKQWHLHTKNSERLKMQDVINALKILEGKIEAGTASPEDRESGINLL